MENTKLTIKQSVLWNTCGSLSYLGAQWLLTVLAVRALGYGEAGILSLAMSVTNIFYAISIYGIKNYQVSDIEDKYPPGVYIGSRFATSFGALGLCMLFLAVMGYGMHKSACIFFYMCFKLSESFFDVYTGFYQKKWRMDLMGRSMVIRAAVMFVLFTTCVFLLRDLVCAVIAMSMGVYLVLLLYDRKNLKMLGIPMFDGHFRECGALLAECFPLALNLLLSTGIGSIPRFFLEQYCGNEQLGIYASVAAPTLIVQMGASYFFNPMVTVFAEDYGSRNRAGFIRGLADCARIIGILSVAAILGGKLFGKAGLYLLFGESILPYGYLLIPLIFCTVLTAGIWLLSAILVVLRDFLGLMAGNAVSVLVSIAGSVCLIPRYGMQGASYAFIAGNLAGVVFLGIFLKKDVDMGFRKRPG